MFKAGIFLYLKNLMQYCSNLHHTRLSLSAMEKFIFFRNGYGKVTCMVSRRVIFGTRITTQFCPAELSQRSYAGDGAMDGGGHVPVASSLLRSGRHQFNKPRDFVILIINLKKAPTTYH